MGTLRVDANLGSVLCNASLGCAYGYFHSIINYAGHQGPDGRLREEIKVSAHVRSALWISTSSAEHPVLPNALRTYHPRQETVRIGSRKQYLRDIF